MLQSSAKSIWSPENLESWREIQTGGAAFSLNFWSHQDSHIHRNTYVLRNTKFPRFSLTLKQQAEIPGLLMLACLSQKLTCTHLGEQTGHCKDFQALGPALPVNPCCTPGVFSGVTACWGVQSAGQAERRETGFRPRPKLSVSPASRLPEQPGE